LVRNGVFEKKSVVVLDYTSKRFSAGPEDKWRWLFYIYFLSALASFSILFYFFFKYVVGGAPKIKYEAKEKKKWQGWWW
jgi:heme/copper-type cytochrome/quinol oxidase subunit 3